MFRNLIFDWSGTLCDDLALTIEATNHVFDHFKRPRLDVESFRAEFYLPYPQYYETKIPEASMEELEDLYRYAFDRAVTTVKLLPHARRFMSFCAAQGIRCFILTSMDSKAFALQVEETGLAPYFEHIHSGIRNKEIYIGQLMEQHGLIPDETAFIGDMSHDIDAAHCASITGIGVLTGYNNAQQLVAASPELIVPDLKALQGLMQRAAVAQPVAYDEILLNELRFDCHIGVPDEERATPQTLWANITLATPARFSEMSDGLEKTICYDTLTQALIRCAQQEPTCLIETLAHKLARCCVEDFGARHATVELHKTILPQMKTSAVRTTYPV